MEYWVEFKGGKHDPKGLKGKKSYLVVVNIVKENDEFKKSKAKNNSIVVAGSESGSNTIFIDNF